MRRRMRSTSSQRPRPMRSRMRWLLGQLAAAGFCWPAVPAVAGIHDLHAEQGPAGPCGWSRSAAGTLECRWACRRCGKKAGNSSRLLEVLREPCGDCEAHCTWEKVNHDTEVVADRISCKRCGTTRQRYVHLGGQACPVRQCRRAGAEVPEGTAVYKTWVRTLQAMHAHLRAVQVPGGAAAAGGAAAGQGLLGGDADAAVAAAGLAGVAAAVVPAGDADGGESPPPVPRMLNLRPFRSHACVTAAQVEFCMRCMSKAPRFQAAAWRTDCCDGDTPVGGVPKHILAAISAGGPKWPARHAARGQLLVEAASAHGRAVAAMALRRPKRRQVMGIPCRAAGSVGPDLPSASTSPAVRVDASPRPGRRRGQVGHLEGPRRWPPGAFS